LRGYTPPKYVQGVAVTRCRVGAVWAATLTQVTDPSRDAQASNAEVERPLAAGSIWESGDAAPRDGCQRSADDWIRDVRTNVKNYLHLPRPSPPHRRHEEATQSTTAAARTRLLLHAHRCRLLLTWKRRRPVRRARSNERLYSVWLSNGLCKYLDVMYCSPGARSLSPCARS
jgi:hypothetical protein